MEKLAGYARVLAQVRVKQTQQTRFFRQPCLKLGQCLALWGYFFQVGGVLGSRYRGKLDAFGTAFLGAQGQPGAVERYFTDLAGEMLSSVDERTTFSDYLIEDSMKRLNYSGDHVGFLQTFGLKSIKPDTAQEVSCQSAEGGAAFGAIYPDRFRTMFDHTHAAVPVERWERAHAAGLDIPHQQELLSFADVATAEDDLFMTYCRECCPTLHAVFAT